MRPDYLISAMSRSSSIPFETNNQSGSAPQESMKCTAPFAPGRTRTTGARHWARWGEAQGFNRQSILKRRVLKLEAGLVSGGVLEVAAPSSGMVAHIHACSSRMA